MTQRLWVTLYILTGLLPFVPRVTSPTSLLFALAYLVLVASTLLENRGRIRVDATGLVSVGVLAYLPVSMVVGMMGGQSLSEVARAATPFLFVFNYLLILQNRRSDREFFVNIVLLSAMAWAVSVVSLNVGSVISSLTGSLIRLTYEVSEMLIPFGMIGFILVLYSERLQLRVRAPFLFVFLILILLSGYRSQIVLVAFAVIFKFRKIYKIKSIFAIAAILVSVVAYSGYNSKLFVTLADRFLYSAGDTVREAERQFAFREFADSIFLGKGLGNPVPISITRPEGVHANFESETVPYIHNFLFYVLMDMGGFGVILFGVLLIPPIVIHTGRLVSGRMDAVEEAAYIVMVVTLIYFQTSASFRQIQMWMILSVMLFVLGSSRAKEKE